ncbi:hypothetical protein CHUAL_008653 [Chamberlinius hualienensis]
MTSAARSVDYSDHKLGAKVTDEKLKNLATPTIAFRNNDSGYFTPSPSFIECIEEQVIEKDNDTPTISDFIRRRHYEKFNPNRRNLEAAKQSDRLRSYQSSTTSVSSPEAAPEPCCDFNIISQLRQHNMWNCLSKITRLLDDRDLTSICCVCKLWRDVCLEDEQTNRRRRKYLKNYRSDRENNTKALAVAEKADLQRPPLVHVENVAEKAGEEAGNSTPTTDVLKQRFTDVIDSLQEHERLDKCGNCGSPARVNQNTGMVKCTLPGCSSEYCINCRGPYVPSHQCSPVKLRMPSCAFPRSRCSKSRLRRLLL